MTNDKLIARKQAWAREGRRLSGRGADPSTRLPPGQRLRLPPGQRLVRDWPVLDLGEQPQITPDKFFLELNGAVQTPQRLTHREFMDLPQVASTSDMHCVTQWSRYDNAWKGVAAQTLLALAQPLPGAKHVVFHAHDNYTTNVRLDQFDQPDVLLVHEWEGKPIDRRHGGPVRVLIPRLYLWKSAKWVRRIEFRTDDQPGFWETRGYHNNADPWDEERYS